MKNKKILILLWIIVPLVIGGLSTLIIWLGNKYLGWDFIFNLIITLASELVVYLLILGFNVLKFISVRIKNSAPYDYDSKYDNQEIRLSFAYLIRIKVNNKYLLVNSGHKRDLYGPVGGVYHIKKTDYVYNKLGFYRDSTPGDFNDIRGHILGKRVKKFVKWFESKIDREITPEREFYEELVNSGILDIKIFGEPSIKYIKTHYKGVYYNERYQKNELLRFDIFELAINSAQEKYLKTLQQNKALLFATKEEIESLGITVSNDKTIIGTQTPYILEDR